MPGETRCTERLHRRKNSKRYRYYVSAPLMGHGDKGDQSLLRISAQAIEDIVEDRVRTLLAFPAKSGEL